MLSNSLVDIRDASLLSLSPNFLSLFPCAPRYSLNLNNWFSKYMVFEAFTCRNISLQNPITSVFMVQLHQLDAGFFKWLNTLATIIKIRFNQVCVNVQTIDIYYISRYSSRRKIYLLSIANSNRQTKPRYKDNLFVDNARKVRSTSPSK